MVRLLGLGDYLTFMTGISRRIHIANRAVVLVVHRFDDDSLFKGWKKGADFFPREYR